MSKVTVVMAFDDGMADQGLRSLSKLYLHRREHVFNVVILDLGLSESTRQDLFNAPVSVSILGKNIVEKEVPCWDDVPFHVRAMTCRPYLRELITNKAVSTVLDTVMWLDADVRIESPAFLNAFLHAAALPNHPIAAVQECDPAYCFMAHARVATLYHNEKRERMREVYGPAASLMQDLVCWNAGIWAMHRDSKVWDGYRECLEAALVTPYNRLKEQDALNMAIATLGPKHVATLPCTYNWLCSAAAPTRNPETGRFVRPQLAHETIHALHLSCSGQKLGGTDETYYEVYKRVGLERD